MENTRIDNLLRYELSHYGVKLFGDDACETVQDGKATKATVSRQVARYKKDILSNNKLLINTLKELVKLLGEPAIDNRKLVDVKLKRMFIFSLEDTLKFIDFLVDICDHFDDVFGKESDIYSALKTYTLKDIGEFSNNAIKKIADYKFILDWIFRRNSELTYIIRLLNFSCSKDKNNSLYMKLARGVSGPWANLDLPMQERVWEWADISEEVSGRVRDIRGQARYKKGLENYNNDGRVGEGYFWREIRNEPFSWYNRGTEDPYPSRNHLSNP